jgi:hypothetical protein
MRSYHLYPVLPVLALVLMPFLPFVNTDALWFGLPRMLVWGGLSCALLTASLFVTDRVMSRDSEGDEL